MTDQKRLVEAHQLLHLISTPAWVIVMREGDAAVEEIERAALDEADPAKVQAAHFKAQGAREFLRKFAQRLQEAAQVDEGFVGVSMM